MNDIKTCSTCRYERDIKYCILMDEWHDNGCIGPYPCADYIKWEPKDEVPE